MSELFIETHSVRHEIKKALKALGYDLEKRKLHVYSSRIFAGRCGVYLDDEYIGVWDVSRKTFVG